VRASGVIRHLIFDMDGTLVDSCAICVEILTGIRVERGCHDPIDPVGARAYMSRGGAQMVAALLGEASRDAEADLTEFRDRYSALVTPDAALFPGVREGLFALRAAGFTLSICSNKPQNLCDQVLRDTGLADLFGAVVGGRAGLRPKPATDLLAATLAELGAEPGDCLYIGDSELDHEVADAMGMPFLFMTYGYADHGWSPGEIDTFDCFIAMTHSVVGRAAPAGNA
jgi:phosphoglycolate phosphatase